jgi:hypothetical protein
MGTRPAKAELISGRLDLNSFGSIAGQPHKICSRKRIKRIEPAPYEHLEIGLERHSENLLVRNICNTSAGIKGRIYRAIDVESCDAIGWPSPF